MGICTANVSYCLTRQLLTKMWFQLYSPFWNQYYCTFLGYLLARTINYQAQIGFFNLNPVFEVCIRCNLKIGKIVSLNASSQSRSTSNFFSEHFVGLLLRESESESKRAHHNPHQFFVWNPPRWYLLLSSLALALFFGGWCPWRCQSTCPCYLCCKYCVRDACSTCHGCCACFCCSFFAFLLILTLGSGRSRAWISSVCLVFPVEMGTWLNGCVRCACVAAIDAPARMIVVVRWVLLCDSQRPHDALVVFVGKAVLRHQVGMLPWPPSSRSTWSFCKALAPLIENGVNCYHRDKQRWGHRLLPLVVTDFA